MEAALAVAARGVWCFWTFCLAFSVISQSVSLDVAQKQIKLASTPITSYTRHSHLCPLIGAAIVETEKKAEEEE